MRTSDPGADLRGSDLTGAILTRAALDLADVRGANLTVVAVRPEQARLRSIARCDLHLELGRVVAQLGEPEAVLVDEVEGEPVTARRDGPANRNVTFGALAGRRAHIGADPVPDDRVAAVVEPVV